MGCDGCRSSGLEVGLVFTVVGWALTASFLIVSITRFITWWRRSVRLREHRGPLAAGPITISGEVVADESPLVLRIEMCQTPAPGATWYEAGRFMQARTFYLRRSNGELVRVDAVAPRVRLMIPLHESAPSGDKGRRRIIRVRPGETISIHGELARGADEFGEPTGYRSPTEGWILKAPTDGRIDVSYVSVRAASFEPALGWGVATVVSLVATGFATVPMLSSAPAAILLPIPLGILSTLAHFWAASREPWWARHIHG
jgi:hypothetical protein